jgi:hypothetical protein
MTSKFLTYRTMFLYKYNTSVIHFLRMQIGEKIYNIEDYNKQLELKLKNKDFKLYKERIENCGKSIINISEKVKA